MTAQDEAAAYIQAETEGLYSRMLGEVASRRVPLNVAQEMFAALWNTLEPKDRKEIADLVEQAKADTVG
jgi:hypothetical protein